MLIGSIAYSQLQKYFINDEKRQAQSCHPMEHEISAIYDIHGLGFDTKTIIVNTHE